MKEYKYLSCPRSKGQEQAGNIIIFIEGLLLGTITPKLRGPKGEVLGCPPPSVGGAGGGGCLALHAPWAPFPTVPARLDVSDAVFPPLGDVNYVPEMGPGAVGGRRVGEYYVV